MKTNGSMNRCYRLVWSQVQQAWMAVAETTRGRGKQAGVGSGVVGTVASAVMGAALGAAGLLGAPAHAAPQGGQVTAGSASVSQSGSTTTIAQSSQNVSLSWQRFNVGAAETVNFVQPSASAIAVNRIFDTQGSQILGRINANGQVWLINPNGVLFGRGAQINVGGLVASTLDVADGDLARGTRRFAGSSSADVVNLGHITAAPGGYVSLLGHQVINHGAISARLGTVALGAGHAISLNFSGSRLLGLQVEQSALNALADNGGLIQAAGGQVLMSAGARDSVLASVVNNTGVIEATTVQEHEGTIVLLGGMTAGTTNVAGTLDASAPNGGDGGFIETSAAHVKVADGAKITTLAPQGRTGTWLIDPTDFTVAAGSAALTTSGIGADTLSSNLGGNTNVTIATDNVNGMDAGDIHVNAAVSWSANTLTLSAWNNININAALNGSGAAKLALEYGQGAVSAGNTSSYNIHAPVSLPAGDNFSTKQGNDVITPLVWTVITTLGDVGSTTRADLQGISGGLTGRYVLGADIDASATVNWNAGAGFAPIGTDSASAFTGSFDGLGHSIGRLAINRPTTNNVGLFGYTGTGSVIRNVGLTDVAITGGGRVGGLVGFNNRGAITNNSYATGSVSGTGLVGGLTGWNWGVITNSHATGSVTGGDDVGGLVGLNDIGSGITNSYATGSVSGTTSVGGLVGGNASGSTITNSYATGSVSGGAGTNVGGLVGVNEQGSAITNSYATGSVSSAGSGVGGLTGWNYGGGRITNSYATGSVSGTTSVGGLVGGNVVGSVITNSYATGSVSGTTSVGGLVGVNGASISNSFWDTTTNPGRVGIGGVGAAQTGVTGLTTAQALTESSYNGWDFDNTWYMVEGSTRPFLRMEYSTTITNAHQLQLIGMDRGAHYTLANNVDLAAELANPSGMWGTASALVATGNTQGFAPIGTDASRFTGSFDGLGHSIGRLTINRPTTDYVGLFGYASAGSVIRNVGLTDTAVTGRSYVGGLVGENYSGNISTSYATGSVIGTNSVGGLVGSNYYSGITNSYATGSVSGANSVGGLVGLNYSATISHSYATGRVTRSGSNAGGLVGLKLFGTITDSYWDMTTTGQANGVGNLANGSSGATGLTTAQALTQGSYTGFDFTNTWYMVDGSTRPFLRMEYSTTITNAHQLQLMGMDLTARYTLANNLDLAAELANPSGMWGTASALVATGNTQGFAPIGTDASAFTGSFDGLGHSIGRLAINRPTTNNVGLFGYTGTGSVIRNVGLTDVAITGGGRVGGLVGFNNRGAISDSYATGSVSGTGFGVGGLVGNNFGTLANSYATGIVTGTGAIGGLVGNNFGTLANSYATGIVTGTGSIGGLVGANAELSAIITNSYATGSVSGVDDVGGLVGFNVFGAIITNSYATGSVNGTDNVGGLVGANSDPSSIITNSYATGSVSGGTDRVGGLVGFNAGVITDSYWDITTTRQSRGIGYTFRSDATGLTTAQLAAALPNGFSASVWGNGGNQTTPYLLSHAAFSATSGSVLLGSDSSTTPTAYQVILNATQLQNINTTGLAGKYVLGTNIDASATVEWNSGDGFAPIGTEASAFTGSFDGLGHSIGQLTINRATTWFVGLFGYTGTGSVIRNVGLTEAVIAGQYYAGALVGVNDGAITNSYAMGSVTGSGNFVGALVGYNDDAITNSYATGSVSGTDYVGGLVGGNAGVITDSYATGSVSGNGSVGGLVGDNYGGTITNSYATGSVDGTTYVGGLVGFNYGGTITNSYATGSVSGGGGVGGLVGYNFDGAISNSYATGSVRGTNNVGGLVGYTYQGSVADSYATGTVTSPRIAGGLVGQAESSTTIENSYATGLVSGSTTQGGLLGVDQDTAVTVTNSYWDTTTTGQANGVGNVANASGATGLSTAQLAAALPTGFSDSVWGNGDNQTTPYLLSHAVFSTTSGSVLLGSDTTPTAYQVILNVTQLQNINTTGLAGNYVLGSNIDASATAAWNAGAGFAPIGTFASSFTGSFDGLGHSIGHLTINRATDYVGLFGATGAGSVIRNVGLTDVTITGGSYVGALVGSTRGDITNSYARGSVSGTDYVGGLLGVASGMGGSITNSYAMSTVSGTTYVGGLIGSRTGRASRISNSYATGSVSGTTYVGGLVGINSARGSSITNSYATGSVSGSSDFIGGLVGSTGGIDSSISNSYATGSVRGGDYVGGLVGDNLGGSAITNSFWDVETTGQSTGIGGGTLAGATGLSTAEMHKGANFTSAGWDFANTWVIYEDHTSPLLRSFMTPLTVTANNAIAPKVYDGSTTYVHGTASYSVTPDDRLQGPLTYTQDSQNAGSRTITPGGLWSDQQGYLISYASGSLMVDKATLTYTPNAATFVNGQTIVGLSGAVLGFVSGDTLADSTTGTLGWSTPATSSSAPGSYRIDGGGLDALNYVFVQASAPDAAVLTLLPSTLPPQVVSTITQVFESLPDSALSTAIAQQQQALQNLQSQQQPASGSPTAFRGLGIDGPGVKLPPTLIGSAP